MRNRLKMWFADLMWWMQQRGWCIPAQTSDCGGAYSGVAPHVRPSRRQAHIAALTAGAGTATVGYDASGPFLNMDPP